MKQTIKKTLTVCIAGIAVTGILAGCGTQSASSTTQASTAASQSKPAQAQTHQRQNLVQRFQDAGLTQTDAKDLAKLVRENHIQIKWVMEQLKNKQSASTIEDAIKNGTAPKIKPKQQGNNSAISNSGANTNNSSSNQTNSTSGSSGNGTSANGTSANGTSAGNGSSN
ncbi:hypothetical protein LSG31_13110 [Fodinisporobacter ferrooxydans]|uniref:Lipoprotein n=1 Tax=Fodinisporobacter ferrooxydans TaxID=2901836 RepID=A0ABY4CFT8_9BACL|nr:hypothetical protein LSG31_13110 [Alicyclobacillaceae bacterium MYW30-H2]